MPKILVTDEQVGGADAVWQALHCLGYDVLCVQDKEEALASFSEIQPDLVITDLVSPGLDGFTFIRKVKTFSPKVPVIVVSGSLDQEKMAKATQAGALYCLSKPFAVEVLWGIVEKALDGVSLM